MSTRLWLVIGLILCSVSVALSGEVASVQQGKMSAEELSRVLNRSIRDGDLDATRRAVSAGASIDMVEAQSGMSPLMVAAAVGRTAAIRELVNAGATTSGFSRNGEAALHLAAKGGFTEAVSMLLDLGVSPNLRDGKGEPAVTVAAGSNEPDVVRLLLQRKGRPNIKNRDGVTALMVAAGMGFVDVAVALIAAGADPNVKEPIYDLTALAMAVLERKVELVKLLVEHGADTEVRTVSGTPLELARAKGFTEIGDILEAKPARSRRGDPAMLPPELNADDYWSVPSSSQDRFPRPELNEALLRQAARGEAQSVAELLRMGASLESKSSTGITPLYAAVASGHPETVKVLIAARADVNVSTKAGTALAFAIRMDHDDLVPILLNAGADVNGRDGEGWTALCFAVIAQRVNTAKELITRGAEVNPDVKGLSLLSLARLGGNQEMIQLLLNNGAK